MGLQDRDWFWEDHDKRVSNIESEYVNACWEEVEKTSDKFTRNRQNKSVNHREKNNNANTPIFDGKLIDIKKIDSVKYHARVVCCRCNFINEVDVLGKVNRKYRFKCNNCMSLTEFKLKRTSTWEILFVVASIVFFLYEFVDFLNYVF